MLNQKKVESVFEARRIVLDQLLEKFQFELDEKEISEYSIEFVRAYEVEAALYDMSLEEYYQEILQVSTDEFFEECYKECEKLVKTYLVIGAIANIEFEEIKLNDKSKVYSEYQSLENRVYSLFINAEKNF